VQERENSGVVIPKRGLFCWNLMIACDFQLRDRAPEMTTSFENAQNYGVPLIRPCVPPSLVFEYMPRSL
jgi:hypothetical protein